MKAEFVKLVMELKSKTELSLADVKKAVEQANGDRDAALKLLHEWSSAPVFMMDDYVLLTQSVVTPDKDRDGDIIEPNGVDQSRYERFKTTINSVVPLVATVKLSDEDSERLRKEIENKFFGPENAGGFTFTPNPLSKLYPPITVDYSEVRPPAEQFINDPEMVREVLMPKALSWLNEQVGCCFGLPPFSPDEFKKCAECQEKGTRVPAWFDGILERLRARFPYEGRPNTSMKWSTLWLIVETYLRNFGEAYLWTPPEMLPVKCAEVFALSPRFVIHLKRSEGDIVRFRDGGVWVEVPADEVFRILPAGRKQ